MEEAELVYNMETRWKEVQKQSDARDIMGTFIKAPKLGWWLTGLSPKGKAELLYGPLQLSI